MPQPNSSNVHVDAVLTNISIAYMQDQSNFIASQVFPEVPVDKQSDKFFVFDKNSWFRDEAQKRAPGTEFGRLGLHAEHGRLLRRRVGVSQGHRRPDAREQ